MTELNRETLNSALRAWPRAELAHLPTPLDYLPRLSARYPGHELWLKRDDCTGLAMGGNKARQLEFYLGDALDQGCDTVLSTGAVQSNYMRTLAAAAAKLGLECHIQLEPRVSDANEDYHRSGNVFLDHLFGATIHHYQGGGDEFGADAAIRQIADSLAAQGRKPYIVPLAPVDQPKGALGYVDAAMELADQFAAMAAAPDLVVVGSGSGLTHAGLLMGFRAMGHPMAVLGACVRREASLQRQRILDHCRKVESMLGLDQVVTLDDVWVDDVALAPGYGKASDQVMHAIAELARQEGVLVDPVYSAKTIATTLALLNNGALDRYRRIVMIHTGGTPALFAYREPVLASAAFGL